MREHCLKTPETCVAKTPGKHCRKCSLTAYNKTEANIEKARARGKSRYFFLKDGKSTSHSPKSNALREDRRMYTMHPWLHRDYRALHNKLKRAKYPPAERPAIIATQIQVDMRKLAALSERLEAVYTAIMKNRMTVSHEKMKRGGSFIGGSIIPLAEIRARR